MSAAAAAAPPLRRERAVVPAEIAPARIMIVDDSAVARSVLARMLAPFADFEVVAQAASAREAVSLLETQRVDVVLLDLDMPGSSGLDALPAILENGAGARILVVSSSTESGSEAAVAAMALGAADTLAKPGTGQVGRFSATLAERLRRLVPGLEAAVGIANAADDAQGWNDNKALVTAPANAGKIGCLAIGASTGGLHAITQLIQGLPSRLGAPILVTQHLPPTFLPLFANQIESACGRRVRVAADASLLRPDEILLAPGSAHLDLEQHGTRVKAVLSTERAESGCTPSVDVMLAAVARVYGKRGVGVVLSGMGRDGLAGGRDLAAAGGRILAQDRDSSAVWGMPGAVARAGLACCIDSPAELALAIGAWARAAR